MMKKLESLSYTYMSSLLLQKVISQKTRGKKCLLVSWRSLTKRAGSEARQEAGSFSQWYRSGAGSLPKFYGSGTPVCWPMAINCSNLLICEGFRIRSQIAARVLQSTFIGISRKCTKNSCIYIYKNLWIFLSILFHTFYYTFQVLCWQAVQIEEREGNPWHTLSSREL
jgi:hypothetical protein